MIQYCTFVISSFGPFLFCDEKKVKVVIQGPDNYGRTDFSSAVFAQCVRSLKIRLRLREMA